MSETSVMLINQSCSLCKRNKLRIDVSKYIGRFRKYLLNFYMHSVRGQDIFIRTTG